MSSGHEGLEDRVSRQLRTINSDIQERIEDSPEKDPEDSEAVDSWISNVNGAFKLLNREIGDLINYQEGSAEKSRRRVENYIRDAVIRPYMQNVADEIGRYDSVDQVFSGGESWYDNNGFSDQGDVLDLHERYLDFLSIYEIAESEGDNDVDWTKLNDEILEE